VTDDLSKQQKPHYKVGASLGDKLHQDRPANATDAKQSDQTPPPAVPNTETQRAPKNHGRAWGPRFLVRLLQRLTGRLDSATHGLVPYMDGNDTTTPDGMAAPLIMRGMLLMFLLFVVIGGWAAFVPMDTGAIAHGQIVVDSNRREVQHLEGGIIEKILVREGDRVEKGEVLVQMDATTAKARNEQLRGQWVNAKATEARLLAERDGLDTVNFPPELLAMEQSDPSVAKGLDAQRRLFDTRRDNKTGEKGLLNQKIRQSEEEIIGLQRQISSANRQISLLNDEISVVERLVKQGNAVRPRLLALQRQAAQIDGQRGQSRAMISRAEQAINEAKIAIANQETEFLNRVVAELKETQQEIGSLNEQMRASADIVRRIQVLAPISGQITGLQVFTETGVVQPGQVLMAIVPLDEALVVEARINPNDIDIVRPGLLSHVRITVVDTRRIKPLKGEVMVVSADRFTDQQTGESYYQARIHIPAAELQEKLGDFTLTAGMPAEVLIVTGQRTMLSYITRPIRDSFGRAFRQE
jgi:HlyD family secretion protein